MKNNCFNRIKSSKPFRPFDALLYAVILILTISLFLIPLLSDKKQSGFKITCNGEEIFTLDYRKKEYASAPFDGYIEVFERDGGLEITVYQNNGEDYNKFLVNYAEKSVTATDANCSFNKDCVHTPTLKSSGAIICAPHGLKVTPVGGEVSLISG